MIDVYARRIVGWRVSKTMRTDLSSMLSNKPCATDSLIETP